MNNQQDSGANAYLSITYYFCFCFISILFSHSTVSAQVKPEDYPVTELQELVVESESAWIEGNKIVFVPSKKEKQLSNSAITLLQTMRLPILNIEGNSIKTITGKPVEIYINGHPTDPVEMATFWPKHAQRVEYIENPTDQEFVGSRNVINFVMTDYDIGGITKLDVTQAWPNSGDYNLASKLVYKKRCSYGILLNGGYENINDEKTIGIEKYKDTYYSSQLYPEIESTENVSHSNKQRKLSGVFVQRYFSEKFSFMHQVGLNWTNTPKALTEGIKTWTPNLFLSDAYSSFTSRSSLIPAINGYYHLKLGSKWVINGELSYKYSKNKSNSWEKTGLISQIENGTSENVNSFSFKLTPAYYGPRGWTFQYTLNGNFDNYTTEYSGTASTKTTQNRQTIDNQLMIWWDVNSKISLSAMPSLNICCWQISNIREHQINPAISFGVQSSLSRKLNLHGEIAFNMYSANPSELNPVLVQNSDLIWTMGNPDLRNSHSWSGYIWANYLPLNQLNLSLHAHYTKSYNRTMFEYSALPEQYGGLLRSVYNGLPEDNFSMTIGSSLSFFSRKLLLSFSGSYTYSNIPSTTTSLSSVQGKIDATYIIGNVQMSIAYRSPMKSLIENGHLRQNYPGKLDFSLTYGWKNLYAHFSINNILNKYTKIEKIYDGRYYWYNTTQYNIGRECALTLTYTFGYGKEVSPNIPAFVPSAETNVLN